MLLIVLGFRLFAAEPRSTEIRNLDRSPPLPSQTREPVVRLAEVTNALARALSAQAADPPIPSTEDAPDAEDYAGQVRREPRDPEWAEAATRTLEEDLRTKADMNKFHIRGIDCRSTGCVAELDFPSLAKAQADFKALLGPPNRLDCHERLLFTPEGPSDGPALGTMIFDCKGTKRSK